MNFFSRKRPTAESEPVTSPIEKSALEETAEPTPNYEESVSATEAEFPDIVEAEPAGITVDDISDADLGIAPHEAEVGDEITAGTANSDVVLTEPVLAEPTPTDSVLVEPVPLEPETSAPPRSLFPGSFLNGEYEIKEVLLRGFYNFYLADAGDYGSQDLKLVAERFSSKTEVVDGPENPFFPPATRFIQEDREYAVWDFENLKPLDEWTAHPNDETYFKVLRVLGHGFAALENGGFKPDLPREGLFITAEGELKSFGFFDMPDEDATDEDATDEVGAGMNAVQQLAALSSRFAKTNLADRATLRLDDEFGSLPFSEEVKTFARSLSDGDFATAQDALAILHHLKPVSKADVALLTDVGMERELNEDCGLVWKSSRAGHSRNFDLELLAVSDGMGGHEGGEVASDLTLTSLEASLIKRLGLDFANNAVVSEAVGEMLLEVNSAVVGLTENPPYASMRHKPGATLVCALRVGSRVFVGNVGDSRAYRWDQRNGLQRLTKDHSYVQDLLDKGAITDEEAWGHPDGSIITSHIGMMRGMKREVFLRYLSAGDRLVLVSDGVVDTLRDSEIEQIVSQHDNASQLCAALVNASNEAGGFDNITVAALICG